MSDVRSLEDVIAAAHLAWTDGYRDWPLINEQIAAAVREWCLAPQQIARAAIVFADQSYGGKFSFARLPEDGREGWRAIARDALHAVMGDTSDDSKMT